MPAPEKLTIDTPEQIALEFTLAGAGSRFLALAIDTLIQIAVLLVLVLVGLIALWLAIASASTARAPGSLRSSSCSAFLLYYGYFAVFEALWRGQTPGKRVVGLRVISRHRAADHAVRRARPQPPPHRRPVARHLRGRRALDLLHARNQRLGDLAAGTVVVQEQGLPQGEMSSTPVLATRLGAARLSIEEVEVIQTFLARRADLPEYLRMHTAGQLAHRIRQRLELPPSSQRDDEALIESVATEYRRR